MVTPSATPVSAAIAKAIAMRWSPPVTMVAATGRPADCPRGVTRQPSCSSSASTPMACNPSTTSAMRSDSLVRSSPASRSSDGPSAPAMTMARSGSSSMRSATRAPSTRMPRMVAPPRTTRSPTGSGPVGSLSATVMSAPISRSTSMMAVRLGLRPTARTRSSASGWSAAAASQKAADEMSPGTSMSRAAKPTGPVDRWS